MIDYEQLVTRARTGDSAAHQALYEDTVNGVWYIVSRLVDRREDAEDLVQDTYVTAFSHLDGLEQPQAFPKWLHRIAANRTTNYLKKKRPVLFDTDEQEEQMLNAIPAVGEDFLPEEFAVNQELRDTLMTAIAQLPEKQRMAIFLHYYEGTPVKELAETLNVGENTVKSRLNAGRAGIRKHLEKAGISGVAMTVLAVALRNDAAAALVPQALRAAMWTAVHSSLTAAGAITGTAAATGATAATATTAAAAVKALFAPLWTKIVAAALAAVIVVGGGASLVSSIVSPGIPAGPAAPYHSEYGIPEEMGSFESIEPSELEALLPLLTHDFSQPVASFLYNNGDASIHYYAGGYVKIYLKRDIFAGKSELMSMDYYLHLMGNTDFLLFQAPLFDGCLWTTDPVRFLGGSTSDDQGDLVYYINADSMPVSIAPDCILIMPPDEDASPALLLSLTSSSGDLSQAALPVPNPPVEEPEQPVEDPEQPVEDPVPPVEEPEQPAETPTAKPEQPTSKPSESVAKDFSLLELVDVTFDEATNRYGSSTYYPEMGYYYFKNFNIGLAYAYGKDAGCNFVDCTLNKILPYCTNMTASQLRRALGGGEEYFDDMEEVYAFAWNYKGCDVVIRKQASGQYGPDSCVTYNCATRVEDALNAGSPATELNFFDLLGKTKSEMETMLGHTLTYSSGYGALGDLVPHKHSLAYTDGANGSGKCIGFFATLGNILPNCPATLTQSQLENIFGKYYDHSWSDVEGFHTVYKGYRLFIYSTDTYSRTYAPNCGVSVIPLNRDINKNAQLVWQGYNSEHWAKMNVTSRTTNTLVCDLEFVQRGGNERGAFTDTITLTSTDGITYTAKGVEDSWTSTLDVTIVFDKSSARVFTDYIEISGMANYRFETDFLVFQKG